MEKLINFFKDEEGATAVEYAVILALIVAAAAGAYGILGTDVNNKLGDVSDLLNPPA